jgi:hypothetical protein
MSGSYPQFSRVHQKRTFLTLLNIGDFLAVRSLARAGAPYTSGPRFGPSRRCEIRLGLLSLLAGRFIASCLNT